ncbi:hypothetical protein [Thermus tengchongensis]|uniref:Uncharacterized protein n=1 Tax=Thermus tengchongensis TaxID=1214928 RepID=A0A4Y9F8M0_9DEIN|nr:hypothetical protein [Thermus tengchongensis]TFU25441.1 hypothetical protein E0687_10980 [Thermus tengchongensis]
MRLLSLLLALVLMWTGAAYASGRAACRVVYAPPLWGVCYAEQVVWAQDPLEVAVGVEARTWPEAQVAPYTLIGLYLEGWWATLEVARPLLGASPWRWAIGAGVRW